MSYGFLCTRSPRIVTNGLGVLLQVAMLWLIKEEIHQESVWTDWLRLIAGTVQKDIQCDDELRQCYKDHVLTTPPRSVYDEQASVHADADAPARTHHLACCEVITFLLQRVLADWKTIP